MIYIKELSILSTIFCNLYWESVIHNGCANFHYQEKQEKGFYVFTEWIFRKKYKNVFENVLILNMEKVWKYPRDFFFGISKKAKNIPFNIIRIDESHKTVRECDGEGDHGCQFSVICLSCADMKDTRQLFSVLDRKFKQISCGACCI